MDAAVLELKPFVDGIGFGEGPRWHEGALWLSDIVGRQVLRIGGDARIEVMLHTPGEPSGLGWLPDGGLLVVQMDEHEVWVHQQGKLRRYSATAPISRAAARLKRIEREARETLLGRTIDFPFPEICDAVGNPDPGDDFRGPLRVQVPVKSLCPCSKSISEYGAHNQRSHVTLTARVHGHVWLEELIDVAEREASCELYGILKRPDEKFVTERAYDNPKFVEDFVRDIALRLNADPRVTAYAVESENFESIHNHSAYALIERRK